MAPVGFSMLQGSNGNQSISCLLGNNVETDTLEEMQSRAQERQRENSS